MNQMNQVVVEGNVTRDSQVKETPRGTRVCVVPIATNRLYKDLQGDFQKETAFLDVEAWGEKYSTFIARMAKKGRGLRVVGRLKQNRWKTPDGKSAEKTFIVAEHIDFQPEKPEEKADSDSKNQAENARNGMIAESEVPANENEFMDGGETVF